MPTTEHLIKMADTCDKMGYVKIGNDIDNLIKSNSFIKVSQYTGFVGTCIRNSRFTSDCIRNKRVTSDAPMQELVMECLSEYQDVNVADKPTDKYASVNDRNYIRAFLKQACSNGIDINTATRKLIETVAINNDIEKDIQQLKDVWAKIEAAGLNKNAEFKEFEQLIKQAGVWDTIKNVGKGVTNWAFYKKRYEDVIKNLTRNVQELQRVTNPIQVGINNLISHLSNNPSVEPQLNSLKSGLTNNDFNSIKQSLMSLRQTMSGPKFSPISPSTSTATDNPMATSVQPTTSKMHGSGGITNPSSAPQAATSTASSKYNYVFAQSNAVINYIDKIWKQMNEAQKVVQLMYENMKTLSQAKALLNVAPQEVSALNQNLSQVSQNPLNVAAVTQLNTTIGNLDAKLRQSVFSKPEETAGVLPPSSTAPATGQQQATVPTAAPAGSAGGVGGGTVAKNATLIQSLDDIVNTYGTTNPTIQQLVLQLKNELKKAFQPVP